MGKNFMRAMKRGTVKCIKGVAVEALNAGHLVSRLVSGTLQSVVKSYSTAIGDDGFDGIQNSNSTFHQHRLSSQSNDALFSNVNPLPLSGLANQISTYAANKTISTKIREQNQFDYGGGMKVSSKGGNKQQMVGQPIGIRDALDTAYNSLAKN